MDWVASLSSQGAVRVLKSPLDRTGARVTQKGSGTPPSTHSIGDAPPRTLWAAAVQSHLRTGASFPV